jgi:hypothetical protein
MKFSEYKIELSDDMTEINLSDLQELLKRTREIRLSAEVIQKENDKLLKELEELKKGIDKL